MPQEEIRIRNARVEDAPGILKIYSYYILHTAITYEYEVPDLCEMQERIRSTLQRYPYLVAEQGDRVIGYAYAGVLKNRPAYDRSCEVTIYLDRHIRHQGVGRLLYEALEQRLKLLDMRNLYACITYPPEGDPYADRNSAQFHAHLGFSLAGTFHLCGYKFGRWYDTIWMEKLIGPHE